MAISVRGTATQTVTGGGTINMPVGTAQNDLAVLFIGSLGGGISLSSSGWTTAKDGTVGVGCTLFAKRMTASPDASVTVASNGQAQEAVLWVLQGVHATTFEDAAGTNAGSTTDPASITTVTNNAWVGAFVAGGGGTPGAVTPSSGYSNALNHEAGVTQASGAWKQVAVAGAENPGAFTVGTTFNDTITWAVRPAAAADTGDSTVGISGAAIVGQQLVAQFGNNDPDGPATGITYQWKADGGDIGGATANAYTVLVGDIGKLITVTVSYTDGLGNAESVTSASIGPVVAASTIRGASVFRRFRQ